MPHIVTAFENELHDLKRLIIEMGEVARTQVAAALDALERRDAAAAGRVRAGDARLDELERAADEAAIRLLALRQPMGGDLRRTVVALRMSTALERIGDYAANIAKRTIAMDGFVVPAAGRDLLPMGRLALAALDEVARAYAERDADRAVAAWRRDSEIDAMHTAVFAAILQEMTEQPSLCAAGAHHLFIAKNIERIGDHATNLAENTYFLITGRAMAGDRPKQDDASFTVVPAPPAAD